MKLTIIPADLAVYENGVCFLDLVWEGTPSNIHALQWDNNSGWIEFNDGTPNQEITELPQWALNAQQVWSNEYNKPVLPPTAEHNKSMAIDKLKKTDWATMTDVADPNKSNPYLVNPAEFLAYRNTVRPYAINPVAGYIDWPTVPTAIWSN